MTFHFLGLSAILFLIQACSTGGSDTGSVEPPVLPIITSPKDGEVVNGVTSVEVNLSNGVLYEKLELVINDEVLAIDKEQSFVLNWNPYFTVGNDAVLVVQATRFDGRVSRSKETLVSIDHSGEADLTEVYTVNGEDTTLPLEYPFGTSDIVVSWGELAKADKYEYRIGNSQAYLSSTPQAEIALTEGRNDILIRGGLGNLWGAWLPLASVVVASPLPPLVNTNVNDGGIYSIAMSVEDSFKFSSSSVFVDGRVVLTSDDLDFSWDPYYWFDGASSQWWVSISDIEGRVIQSDRYAFDELDRYNYTNRINVILPSGGPNYFSTNILRILWEPLVNATYEYKLNGVVSIAIDASLALERLEPSEYEISVRAVNEEGFKGPWGQPRLFSIVLPAKPVFVSKNNAVFKDVDTVLVEWANVAGANGYRYRFDGEWTNTTGNSLVINTPRAGLYSVEIQALDPLGRFGESTVLMFHMAAPTIPELSPPLVRWLDDHYDVSFNLGLPSEGGEYLIKINGQDDVYRTSDGISVISLLDPGQYSWQLKHINKIGHESDWSPWQEFSVGVFRSEFGGTGREIGIKLVHSYLGGYWVLSQTDSPEFKISGGGYSPLLVKFSENGEKISHEVFPPNESLIEILEDIDGNVYLTGFNGLSGEALVYKLSSAMDVVWRKTFMAQNESDLLYLSSAIIFDGDLVVAAQIRGGPQVSSFFKNNSLMKISTIDGTEKLRKDLPLIAGAIVNSVNALKLNSLGELVLGGILDASDEQNTYNYIAYLVPVDGDLNVGSGWASQQYQFQSVGGVEFISNEEVVVLGQGGAGTFPRAVVNAMSFDEVSSFSDSGEYYSYNNTEFSANGTGGFIALYQDVNKYPQLRPMVVVDFLDVFSETSKKYLLDEIGGLPVSLVRNSDETATILFGQQDNLIIRRLTLPSND